MADGQIGAPGVFDPVAAWRQELAGLDPRSHEYGEMVRTLIDLGVDLPASSEPALDSEAPPGFIGATVLAGTLEVPARQFAHTVPPLSHKNGPYVVEATELTTDTAKRVRVVDLRPALNGELHGIAPNAADQLRVTRSFYFALRSYVDTGWSDDIVVRHGTRGSGPCYARAGSLKARAYWTPVRVVEEGGDHVMTVARVGDCGDDPNHEIDFYRRVLGIKLHKIRGGHRH